MSDVTNSIDAEELDDLEENPCGYTYDHSEETVYEDEELIQWTCRACGAEGYENKQ